MSKTPHITCTFLILSGLLFSYSLIENITGSHGNGFPKEIKYFKDNGGSLELVTVKTYYEDGTLSGVKTYKDNKKYGKWESFYENGSYMWKGVYFKGKRSGKWTEFYDNGQISSSGNYTDGKNDGVFLEYYRDGVIKSEENWKDGKYHGKQTWYYENGSTESGNYKEGKLID